MFRVWCELRPKLGGKNRVIFYFTEVFGSLEINATTNVDVKADVSVLCQ